MSAEVADLPLRPEDEQHKVPFAESTRGVDWDDAKGAASGSNAGSREKRLHSSQTDPMVMLGYG